VNGNKKQMVTRRVAQPIVAEVVQPEDFGLAAGHDGEFAAMDAVLGAGEPQRVGRFKFFLDGQRWEWSDALAQLHGYKPGTVVPTTELLLAHKHPDDREQVAAVLQRVALGEPFSSRHRIVDVSGRTRTVIVVGDVMCDHAGKLIGTTGFYIDVTEAVQTELTTAVTEVVASRAEIEQAKGVLMVAYGLSAQRAFDLLVWRSQETNVKVHDIAVSFMSSLAGEVSGDTRSRIDHALITAGPKPR
jgi:PAS domain S-box-containing protein